MTTEREAGSPLVRFLDSFLHERNIKWILSVGMLILLASSIRLVATHWGEYTPFWKYGILISYTVSIYLIAQFANFRLGLKRTGTVLMALTVLLIPLTFLALHWIRPSGSMNWSLISQQAGLTGLLVLNLVFAVISTRTILTHFLRTPQTTFQIAYLALCLAGAIIPGLPHQWAPGIAAVLWIVFTLGTIKVNRHVFWLMEAEQQPRIFGFFPILLLGSQFLGLFAGLLARDIAFPWWGLGCALVAVPVLLTSNAVARVFQERTGNLVRPLPQSIIIPLLAGLLLCVASLPLAASTWPPYALVPTAALVAIAMMVVAQRTQYTAFVWAGILCILVSYQFSPIFFQQLARSVVQSGATMVQESRLPYAFYGLTYLPVLISFSIASILLQRMGQTLFSAPLRQVAIGLSCLLLLVALGHPKATFPVSLALLSVFVAQTIFFRERFLLIPANIALIELTGGIQPFLHATNIPAVVNLANVPSWMLWSGVAFLQLTLGSMIDRRCLTRQHPTEKSLIPDQICQYFSLAVTLIASAVILAGNIQHPAPIELTPSLVLGSLLVAHALKWSIPALSLITLIFLNLTGFVWLSSTPTDADSRILLASVVLVTQWAIGAVLQFRPTLRISRVFAAPLEQLSTFLLLTGILLIGFPILLMLHAPSVSGAHTLTASFTILTIWAMLAAWKTQRAGFTVLGILLGLGTSTASLPNFLLLPEPAVYPLIWSLVAFGFVAVARVLGQSISRLRFQAPDYPENAAPGLAEPFKTLGRLAPQILAFLLAATLLSLHPCARIAAIVAAAGLLWRGQSDTRALSNTTIICLLNWQLVIGLIAFLVPEVTGTLNLKIPHLMLVAAPLAAFFAASLLITEAALCFTSPARRDELKIHRGLLGVGSGLALLFECVNHPGSLQWNDALLAVFTFSVLGISQLIRACRLQSARAVWGAEVLAILGTLYLASFNVVNILSGGCLYAQLVLAVLMWSAGKVAERSPKLKTLAGPFLQTAFWLPLLAVGLGLARFYSGTPATWKGYNSLALLIAAAFYFCQGMQVHRKERWTLAAVIVNVSIMLLWGELQWNDPQLFMIPIGATILLLSELLSQEIPERFHDPLRYIAALTILVSPTFEIVSGSWLHLLTLMIASVLMILLAMGMRLRALVYTGTAFLIADLIAFVIRGSQDNPNLLWGVGIILGLGCIGLAAVCENHREVLMSRIRHMSARMEAWR